MMEKFLVWLAIGIDEKKFLQKMVGVILGTPIIVFVSCIVFFICALMFLLMALMIALVPILMVVAIPVFIYDDLFNKRRITKWMDEKNKELEKNKE
jgi:hypothetical protein